MHILRHTFYLHLVMRGAAMRSVQELVGHQDLNNDDSALLAPESVGPGRQSSAVGDASSRTPSVETSLTTSAVSRHTFSVQAAGAGSHQPRSRRRRPWLDVARSGDVHPSALDVPCHRIT